MRVKFEDFWNLCKRYGATTTMVANKDVITASPNSLGMAFEDYLNKLGIQIVDEKQQTINDEYHSYRGKYFECIKIYEEANDDKVIAIGITSHFENILKNVSPDIIGYDNYLVVKNYGVRTAFPTFYGYRSCWDATNPYVIGLNPKERKIEK
jgi:hypothetical protein